jgi:2-polyprenyl-6-methoxyphenol hydroxylase-like FAD-dependent oxidoreductase
MSRPVHAVVLGAGVAGILAAAALAGDVADTVTVIERDRLPREPAHRTGLPQAHHAHLLWSGGARMVDQLLPDATARLAARGAHRLSTPSDSVVLTAHGWLPRSRGTQYAIACTRDLLDWTLREQAESDQCIHIRDQSEVVGLTGDAARVTGVQIRARGSSAVEQITADLVVDATGRGSRAKDWLIELSVPGVAQVRKVVIDSGLAYVTRIFQAPAMAAQGFPMVSVQSDVPTVGPGKAASLLPVEHGRWLVTLAGTRGHQPPSDEAGFLDFARHEVRHPIIADLISSLQPLTGIHSSRSTSNRRLYFEQLPHWPDGFVVLSDALATFNPIYGHGMSVAAHSCLALRHSLETHGLGRGSGRRLQRTVARTIRAAWQLATSIDIFYPAAGNNRPSRGDRVGLRYVNRVIRAATRQQAAATAAFFDTISLSAPPTRLASPPVVLAALRPLCTLPAEASARPPLTDDEFRRGFADRPPYGADRPTANGRRPTGSEGADQHPVAD